MLTPPLMLRDLAAARCDDHVRRADHHRRYRRDRPLRTHRRLPLRYRAGPRALRPAPL